MLSCLWDGTLSLLLLLLLLLCVCVCVFCFFVGSFLCVFVFVFLDHIMNGISKVLSNTFTDLDTIHLS